MAFAVKAQTDIRVPQHMKCSLDGATYSDREITLTIAS
jgi:hypothetical protein